MNKKLNEFSFEESVFEKRAEELGSLELPLSKRTLILLFSIAFLFSVIIVLRLESLGIKNGEFYSLRSAMNVGKSIILPASRGNIYDRFNVQLVENEPAISIALNAATAKKNKESLDEILTKISAVIGIEKSDLENSLQKNNLEKNPIIILARNISTDQLIETRGLNFDSLEIQNDYRRSYLKGPILSHLIGYTGLAEYNDVKGKTGLESYYDSALQGTNGLKIIYKDAHDNSFGGKLFNESQPGFNLYTSIDLGLQTYFHDRLKQTLNSLGRDVGVGIAINPQNGEILSIVNLPDYDNNAFTDSSRSKDRGKILSSSFQPLFNRAVSGIYSPGSTIKPLVAVAALNEKIIEPDKQLLSTGEIEIPNPYFEDKPSRFLDWRPQGWVDMYSALARSSNIYFYTIGGGLPNGISPQIGWDNTGEVRGLGIEKLKEYWKLFGLEDKTGIDIDSENSGYLPDPVKKEQRNKDPWRLGDTYNVSIGQGDLLTTPIELINYIAAIANGGKLYKPKIVKSIKDENNKIIKEFPPEILRQYPNLTDYIKIVQKGMEDAVNKDYGTARLLADLPIGVAAKTGSAQIASNTKTNAFFVGYLPAEALAQAGMPLNKQIAILVLIENAKEGSLNAVPVAKDVLDWYYYHRLLNNE